MCLCACQTVVYKASPIKTPKNVRATPALRLYITEGRLPDVEFPVVLLCSAALTKAE